MYVIAVQQKRLGEKIRCSVDGGLEMTGDEESERGKIVGESGRREGFLWASCYPSWVTQSSC
jgi:hypothetical protein